MASILELVAKPSCRGSSRSRDQTHVSCIAGGFFITEPLGKPISSLARLLSHFSHVRLCDLMDSSPAGSSVPQDSPGKNTGAGCPALLQEIFPTQGWKLCLSLMSPALASKLLTNSATWEALPSLELPPKDQLC